MKYINLLAFLIMVFMNYLYGTLHHIDITPVQFPAIYPPNLLPLTGFKFFIWIAVYLFLLIFLVAQIINKQPEPTRHIGWWFVVSCILNIMWLLSWHHRLVEISIVLMVLLLTSLVVINRIITTQSGGLAKAALGIYLGWICLATIANVSIFLVSNQWDSNGLSENIWAAGMVLLAALLTGLSLLKLRNPFLALSVIWGFAGIILTRMHDVPNIALAAAGGIVIIASAVIVLSTTVSRKNQKSG